MNALQTCFGGDSEHIFSDVREEAYVATLVSCAERAGLFSKDDANALQASLYALLCEITLRVGKGKSSSVRVEQAEAFLESALFAVGVALKKEPTPASALERLKKTSLRTLFAVGQTRIKQKVLLCRAMHQKLCKQLFDSPNVFYRSTAADGIAGFFRLYEPLSGGYELHITADYPTCLGRPQANGIEFIESYLKRLQAENDFLRLFSPEKVDVFLEKLVPNYAQVPMNLFEPVFCGAALLAAAGQNPCELGDRSKEHARMWQTGDTNAEALFKQAAQMLYQRLDVPEHVRQYSELCKLNLIAAMRRQAEMVR